MAILEALATSLDASDLEPRDSTTVALAAKLAQHIDATDDPKTIGDLSSRLLAVLNALGLTPLSRGMKGVTDGSASSHALILDELRARRNGANGTASLDAPA